MKHKLLDSEQTARKVEARTGVEPVHKGFADLSLSTATGSVPNATNILVPFNVPVYRENPQDGDDYGYSDGARGIYLTQDQIALVDAEDWIRASRYSWCAVKTRAGFYAAHDNQGKLEYLHRFILNAQPGEEIDHVDRNGLNCRRGNLRKVVGLASEFFFWLGGNCSARRCCRWR